ncbi:hypothetical protein U1Q18_011985, partial [Sarracenia purpurea var. burkii]
VIENIYMRMKLTMESRSFCSSSSTNSNPYSSYPQQDQKPKLPPPPSFRSALHSVRKLPASKSYKKPIAPLSPTPPRIYKVKPIDFKQLVQKLTGGPNFPSRRRLQSMAPLPLSLSATPVLSYGGEAAILELFPSPNTTTPPLSATYRDLTTDQTLDTTPWKPSECFDFGAVSPLGFNLSPSSHALSSFPLLSPGTYLLNLEPAEPRFSV